MASIRELRRKIKSVKSTQQITRAMKLVAAARLNRAQDQNLKARPFAMKMEDLLEELAYLIRHSDQAPVKIPPLMQRKHGNRLDIVVVTGDRGLCGAFNASVLRKTVQLVREHKDRDIHLWPIGKKGRDYIRRFKVNVEKEYVNIFHRLGYHHAELIGDDLMNAFLTTDSREVLVLYNEFKSRIQQKLTLKTLLPIRQVEGVKPKLDFIYEPSREEIYETLLPRHIKAQLYRILLESYSAELAARMTAMDSATTNAHEIINNLTLVMNKVRQAGITKELSEIVSGADALKSD